MHSRHTFCVILPNFAAIGHAVWQFATTLIITRTQVPYEDTQCYLPPGRGDIPAFTLAKLVLDVGTLVTDN